MGDLRVLPEFPLFFFSPQYLRFCERPWNCIFMMEDIALQVCCCFFSFPVPIRAAQFMQPQHVTIPWHQGDSLSQWFRGRHSKTLKTPSNFYEVRCWKSNLWDALTWSETFPNFCHYFKHFEIRNLLKIIQLRRKFRWHRVIHQN